MKLRLKKAAYPGNAITWSKKYKYGFIYFNGWVLTVDLTYNGIFSKFARWSR